MHPRVRTKGRRSQSKRKLIASRWSGPIEALEVRRLLDNSPSTTLYPISALYSAPISSTGWAQLPTQTNGWIVYVSSSEGDDGNTGHDPDHPVATLAKAKTLMRDGHDDEMLLLRGDVWDEPIGAWTASGPSLPGGGFDTAHPQVISYYSSDPNNPLAGDRPLIDSGTNDGITFVGHASDVAIIGLQFSPNSINGESYDGTNSTGVAGMRFQLTGSDYLVEDCLVDGYKDNIVVGNPGSPVTDFVMHRSESLDSYNATGAHSQGLYVSGGVLNGSAPCNDILIQENTFDHNGWNDNVAGADKTFFNHNMYINTGATNVTVDSNVVTEGSLRGTLLRSGGLVEDNFYDQNAVGIQVDNADSTVIGNVILEGDDLPSLPSGVGIDVSFDMQQVDIEDNIIAHDISDYTSNVSGIDVEQGTGKATLKNNIVYDWRRPLIDGTDDGMTATGNDFEEFDSHHSVINVRGTVGDGEYSDNTYYDPNINKSFEIGDDIKNDQESFNSWVGQTADNSGYVGNNNVPPPNYSDPNRSMATYIKSLGLGTTFNDWITAQRSQSRGNWNTAFTAASEDQYIAAGFNEVTNVSSSLPRINVSAAPLNSSGQAAITETSSTPATFTLTRTDGSGIPITSGSLTVNYTISGTATSGLDYTLSPATSPPTAFFADGQSTTTITVTPIHDTSVVQPVTVKLNVTASSSNPLTYLPGGSSSATITINDVDGSNSPPTSPGNPTPPGDDGGGSGGEGGSPATGTGLTASFYNEQDLPNKITVKPDYSTVVSTVGFSVPANGTVAPGINTDYFSVAYTGKIQPPETGTYTFQISVDADAAVQLYVNDGGDDDEGQIELYANHRMGDANDDGSVDSNDFAQLAAHFGQSGMYWKTGDFNGDGVVNALDFNALATNYGTSDPRTSQTLTGSVQLEGGVGYDMELEYAQKVGDAKLQFLWKGPGISSFTDPGTENRLYFSSDETSLLPFTPDMSSDQLFISTMGAAPASQTAGANSIFSNTPIANDKDVLG